MRRSVAGSMQSLKYASATICELEFPEKRIACLALLLIALPPARLQHSPSASISKSRTIKSSRDPTYLGAAAATPISTAPCRWLSIVLRRSKSHEASRRTATGRTVSQVGKFGFLNYLKV